MPQAQGLQLVGTTILGAGFSDFKTLTAGMQGVVVCSLPSNYDPAIHRTEVVMRMPGVAGSGFIVASTSKLLVGNLILGPLYFPAGEYGVRTIAGSSLVGALVGIYPTL